MSIGNPVMAVKGTIKHKGICLWLGRNAGVWSNCPICTVSVVGSFNLRGDFDLFSFWMMLDGRGGGARGLKLVSLWEIGRM
jgi:hypothetical protein